MATLAPLLLLVGSASADPVTELSWMAGCWRGELDGALIEEIWSTPQAGHMLGMFRMLREGQPLFYELMAIEGGDGGPALRLKHFDPGLVGWERRKQAMDFALVESEAGAWARFEGQGESLLYRREGPGLVVELRTAHGEQRFPFGRCPAPATEGGDPG
jgi:hypothetical protein